MTSRNEVVHHAGNVADVSCLAAQKEKNPRGAHLDTFEAQVAQERCSVLWRRTLRRGVGGRGGRNLTLRAGSCGTVE